MAWSLVAALAALVLAWLPVSARDEWRAIADTRPVLSPRAANLQRLWVALLYLTATAWLLAVLWLVWAERLAALLPEAR